MRKSSILRFLVRCASLLPPLHSISLVIPRPPLFPPTMIVNTGITNQPQAPSLSPSLANPPHPLTGAPFDTGTSYRPGARFGPSGIRQGSRRLNL